ncbi:MAG: TetR/AcrR family transcriptional regulator [Ignavibacteriales bacterium]|nr:TetR/AcrR family transcriptional regulator [Ignavibacteriales bacterium]
MTNNLEVRERVLEHARDAFLSRGFSKVTLDEIASDLGISKKTLYKFYPSKEELLRASLHTMMRSAGWELERISSSDKPFAEKLAEAMVTMGKYISRLRKEGLADVQRNAPLIWRELDKFREEHIVSKLVAMIVQARNENIFRPEIHEQVLIRMLMSSIQGVINPQVLTQCSFSAQEAAQNILKVLFEGALTDAARKEFHVFDKPTEFV